MPAAHPWHAEFFVELARRGLAARLSICAPCGTPIGIELCEQTRTDEGTARALVSHGLCATCLEAHERMRDADDEERKRLARAAYDAATWEVPL